MKKKIGPSIHFFEKILMIPANKETFNEIGGQSRDIIIDLQSFFSNKIVPKRVPIKNSNVQGFEKR